MTAILCVFVFVYVFVLVWETAHRYMTAPAADAASGLSPDAGARFLVKHAVVELRYAAASLEQAAQALKDDRKGFRASHAIQASERAKAAAEELSA